MREQGSQETREIRSSGSRGWTQNPIVESQAARIARQIFIYLRRTVRYDMDMLELSVVSGMIRRELPTDEDYLRQWLSYMDSE